MSVKKGNTRVIFTCSQKQADWLSALSKKLNVSASFIIRFALASLSNKAMDYHLLSDDEKAVLFEIAHTPWLK